MASNDYPATRQQTNVWLVGEPISAIGGQRLPTNADTIRRFFCLHKIHKKTVREAATTVVQEVQEFWDRAGIPTAEKHHSISKVELIFKQWRLLLKGRNRRSQPQLHKERVFTEALDNLFDIAHANVLAQMTIAEDRAFLISQREGRVGYIAGVDQTLADQDRCTRTQTFTGMCEA